MQNSITDSFVFPTFLSMWSNHRFCLIITFAALALFTFSEIIIILLLQIFLLHNFFLLFFCKADQWFKLHQFNYSRYLPKNYITNDSENSWMILLLNLIVRLTSDSIFCIIIEMKFRTTILFYECVSIFNTQKISKSISLY